MLLNLWIERIKNEDLINPKVIITNTNDGVKFY